MFAISKATKTGIMNSAALNKSTQAGTGNVNGNSEENGMVLLWFL